jgi:hypothetical protein
VQVPVIV